MKEPFPRIIPFAGIYNFRDLGGYRARGGRAIAWRRLFRSGELHHLTPEDGRLFTAELNIKTVIDLRGVQPGTKAHEGWLENAGLQILKIPCNARRGQVVANQDPALDEAVEFKASLQDYGPGLAQALAIIADKRNHPVVFHCNAGKYRSGILAALILSLLGVSQPDIVADYVLSDRFMPDFVKRWNTVSSNRSQLDNLPSYHLRAVPESIELFLRVLKKEYGSAAGYLAAHGVDKTLIKALEDGLLE